MGDFNLPKNHECCESLRAIGAEPAITDVLSTLATAAGDYAYLSDNLWKEAESSEPIGEGILRFRDLMVLD